MNKLLAITLALSVSSTCMGAEAPDWLIGTWQSNEKMTLDDMNKNHEVSEKAHQIFDRDFFGKLVHIFRKEESAAYFIDEKPDVPEFVKYHKVIIKENSVTFSQYSDILGEEVENTIYKEGACFYALVSKWKFKEYFCPVK